MTSPRSGEPDPGTPFHLASTATAVLDRQGVVIGWNPAAEEFYGLAADDVLGRPAHEVLAPADGLPLFGPDAPDGLSGETRILRTSGGTVRAMLHVLPLGPTGPSPAPAAWAVMSLAAEQVERWATDQAMLVGLFHQSPIGLTVYGPDGRVTWVNPSQEIEFRLDPSYWMGKYVRDIMPEGEIIGGKLRGGRLDEVVAQVFRTGEPVIDLHYRLTVPGEPGRERVFSCSYFRLQGPDGNLLGVCESAFEITARYTAQRRLELLSRSSSIGTTLDVVRTSEEFVAVAVPGLADAARVDLATSVLAGQEPAPRAGDPAQEVPAGDRRLVLPLKAGAAVLGTVTLTRTAGRAAFDDADRGLAGELVAHTAVCVDNARRYAREHATALLLQRSLLPQELPEHTAVESAHRYVPGAGPTGVGGDWYDVIPLSGARVGLVVGDVVGHGLHAAVTMGRLRTTVRALAALDLAPDELLSRLDDLVGQARIGIDPKGTDGSDPAVCARCLYVVYDPVHGRIAAASAGHLPPVVVPPEGPAAPLDVPVGLPLGVGGMPFEAAEFEMAEHSLLALFTDGLVTGADRDPDAGVAVLCQALTAHSGLHPDELARRIVETEEAADARDDAALLLVRVRALAEDDMASWRIDSDPAEVAGARASTNAQLERWGLDAVGFAVELIVSELVTNAIRYGAPPVDLRLLRDRDRALICEVSDGRETSPRLRRARPDEEGGRGLFLVAQLADRWGTRYTREGKTIWAEVPIRPDTEPTIRFDFGLDA
ncbi:SpoIIE family protein phosphatase [Streptomyces sp. HUAS MG47]|uniref:SpoIIE family protein phosphatase n=1 Tax=Streptomyces solicamelliae TaxID=3231716 RepID=UPI003877A0CD